MKDTIRALSRDCSRAAFQSGRLVTTKTPAYAHVVVRSVRNGYISPRARASEAVLESDAIQLARPDTKPGCLSGIATPAMDLREVRQCESQPNEEIGVESV